MKPYVACILGMMVGSIVLLSSAVYRPHDLSLFQIPHEKYLNLDWQLKINPYYIKYNMDISLSWLPPLSGVFFIGLCDTL